MNSNNTFQLSTLPSQTKLIKPLSEKKSDLFLTYKKGRYLVLKTFQASNPQRVRRYETEIKVTSALNHSNILTPIEYGSQCTQEPEQSYFYTFTEYMPNGTLFEMFANNRIKLSETLQRSFFHYLVSGLEHIHQNGRAHVDLKLDNIIIGNDYQPKIFDFDLSYCEEDPILRSAGTKNYRAPELVKKDPSLDPQKCDIYSLGVILFILNNGCKEPFHEVEKGNLGTLRAVMDARPDLFWTEYKRKYRSVPFEWSDDFKTLFEGMVRSDPADRFSLEQVKASTWFNGPILSDDEFTQIMAEHFNEAN